MYIDLSFPPYLEPAPLNADIMKLLFQTVGFNPIPVIKVRCRSWICIEGSMPFKLQ